MFLWKERWNNFWIFGLFSVIFFYLSQVFFFLTGLYIAQCPAVMFLDAAHDSMPTSASRQICLASPLQNPFLCPIKDLNF